VRDLEAAAGVEPAASLDPASRAEAPAPGTLWSPALRRRTAALWIVWFCVNFSYYGAFIWLPTLLVESGFSMVRSFEFTLIITLAQLPGYAAAAYLIERWGRRPTLTAFLVGSAAAAASFGMAGNTTMILVAGMALSFFNLGAWGALYAVTPEVYPTLLRGTGAGSAAGFGRIASIVAPLSVPPLLSAPPLFGLSGNGLVFAAFAVTFSAGALGALALPERRGEALED
jgi:MFS transporter, putative metabolite:H+ symporter